MALSWNEIRERAVAFSREWHDETSEDGEAKSFLDAFFHVFDVPRRRVATFETRTTRDDGSSGYIDLLWRGVILIEMKSRGRDLDRAHTQATSYFPGLADRDLPRYVMVSDFARIRLYDLETGEHEEFLTKDLHKHVRRFGFMAGYQTQKVRPEDPANIKAAELMGRLHDMLKESGYEGHHLEIYLVRLLFLLFAEDTSIFEKRQFQDYLETKTAEDGHDLGHHLTGLFHVLNTPEDKRQRTLDESLADFTYVNGRLFEEAIPPASFDRSMRNTLLDLCGLDWSRISPAIFGSLFQSVMDSKARRNLGAHYTTEQNILKLIKPLFLDDLWAEFNKVKAQKKKLVDFHKKVAHLRFLDPACGCGNFLVIAYRELRLLELEILRVLLKDRFHGSYKLVDISPHVWVDVDQFYGIEIEDFPAQIAQVALWMTDHQMNMLFSEEFGNYFTRLPLKKSPNIVHGNALRLDWTDIIEPARLSYILGNPPFVGAKYMDEAQRADAQAVFEGINSAGLLDFVAAWHVTAAALMARHPHIRTAFVSTNSLTQGEQAGALWGELLNKGMKIHFAHRTFQWSSEARGKAAVHCVIVGFAAENTPAKVIYEYDTPQAEPQAVKADNINPYLVDAPDFTLPRRTTPLCAVPLIGIGNKPIDGGAYLFTQEEKAAFLTKEPQAKPYFKRWLGSEEFINGWERWCLWLGDMQPETLKKMPESLKRVEAVRKLRLASKSAPTRKLAETPTRFHVENMPRGHSLLIPKVSSERRSYIPIGFIGPETLCSDLVMLVPDATLYHFGVITSLMHMAWVRAVCGRLKSDYRYSASLVYNNYPWPDPDDKRRVAIEEGAQGVLEARKTHPDSTLADLYDPLTMPSDLRKAHQKLDKAVDGAYGMAKFPNEAARVAFLFDRYQSLVSPLTHRVTPPRKKGRPR